MNKAIALKYNVEPILDSIEYIPKTLHGFDIDPNSMVDILILKALDSFEICSFYPQLPVITDPVVNEWCNQNYKAYSAVWHNIRIPYKFSGWEASYLRLDNVVWIHYLY